MPLNDRELLVVATKAMRFSEKDALNYMKAKGHHIEARTYYRILGTVESKTKERLFWIAKHMKERHLERIEELQLIKKELWRTYHEAQKAADKGRILNYLTNIQPWISSYDESTAGIIEDVIKNFGHEQISTQDLSIFS